MWAVCILSWVMGCRNVSETFFCNSLSSLSHSPQTFSFFLWLWHPWKQRWFLQGWRDSHTQGPWRWIWNILLRILVGRIPVGRNHGRFETEPVSSTVFHWWANTWPLSLAFRISTLWMVATLEIWGWTGLSMALGKIPIRKLGFKIFQCKCSV